MTATEMQNEEHREAYQAEVNARNDKFIASLDEKAQAKFKAVGEALKILTEAGVVSYVFPLLPTMTGAVLFYQYNNGGDFIVWKDGKMSQESVAKANTDNFLLVAAFENWMAQYLPKDKNPETVFAFFSERMVRFQEWYKVNILSRNS